MKERAPRYELWVPDGQALTTRTGFLPEAMVIDSGGHRDDTPNPRDPCDTGGLYLGRFGGRGGSRRAAPIR